jgi:uncharacterized cupin superfamily protein
MMEKVFMRAGALIVLGIGIGVGAQLAAKPDVVLPAEISSEDIGGAIFERPETIRKMHGDNPILDVTTLLSSDGKFASGMYRSGKVRFEADEPYGVDEFMYFIEGGVTLTSSDGTVQTIEAGEAVTIPREWTGVWDTDGYTKIWVIYSEDGSGL